MKLIEIKGKKYKVKDTYAHNPENIPNPSARDKEVNELKEKLNNAELTITELFNKLGDALHKISELEIINNNKDKEWIEDIEQIIIPYGWGTSLAASKAISQNDWLALKSKRGVK